MKPRIFIWSVLAGTVAVALATVTPATAQESFDPPGSDRAIAVQETNTDRLFEIEGVVGTGVGVDGRGRAGDVNMTEDDGYSAAKTVIRRRIEALRLENGPPGVF